jgi:N-methylhydantoinase B
VQARHDIRFSSQMDRVVCKPWGLFGGLAGHGNGVAIHRFAAETEQHFPNGKALNQALKSGDAYILRSGGGGGFGSPLDRELMAVEHDVRCGYVSKEAAEKYYGVVFVPQTSEVDIAASDLERAKMRAQGLPHDEPIAEPAVAPPAPHDHAHHREHERLTDEERLVMAMSCRCCT